MKFTLAISMCDPSHYLPLATAAEACGWDAVCVPEGGPWTKLTSIAYEGGERWWGPDTAFLDPFVVIPAMAAVTDRIRFYTNVLKVPIRSPLLLARAVASAAVLSGDRVALGVGLGWNRDEFEALGVDFETRGPRTDEALEVLKLLFQGGMVEFHGEYFDFPPLQQAPVPGAAVPLYVGGDSAPALRRAARHGDGWIARAPDVEGVVDLLPRLDAALAAEGRDRSGFEIHAMCPNASEVAQFQRLAGAGVTDAEVWPWNRYGVSLADLAGKIESVERFAKEVIEPLR
jgi:probable F420-dependent oxidoreductase